MTAFIIYNKIRRDTKDYLFLYIYKKHEIIFYKVDSNCGLHKRIDCYVTIPAVFGQQRQEERKVNKQKYIITIQKKNNKKYLKNQFKKQK